MPDALTVLYKLGEVILLLRNRGVAEYLEKYDNILSDYFFKHKLIVKHQIEPIISTPTLKR